MHRFFYELDSDDFNNLDLFALFSENELRMKKTTFEYATKRMGLKQSTLDSAYRVLVEGEPRSKVIDETGINESHLSKTVNNIYKNLKTKCEQDGLILTDEYLIKKTHKAALSTLEILEAEALVEVAGKKRAQRSKNKKKKQQD